MEEPTGVTVPGTGITVLNRYYRKCSPEAGQPGTTTNENDTPDTQTHHKLWWCTYSLTLLLTDAHPCDSHVFHAKSYTILSHLRLFEGRHVPVAEEGLSWQQEHRLQVGVREKDLIPFHSIRFDWLDWVGGW